MADIEISRKHHLGLAAARKAADRMAEDLGRKFGLTGGWTGNTHHFDRPGVTGSLALTEKELHLSVKLGFLLKAMRGPLEAAILRELDALFADPGPGTGGKAARAVKPKTAAGGRKKDG